MLYAKTNGDNIEIVKEEYDVRELCSFYELLECVSMGILELNTEFVMVNDGIVYVEDENEDIELVVKFENV